MARAWQGDVCVRSSRPLSSQNVSCMSRAGWSAGMFSAAEIVPVRLHLRPGHHDEPEPREDVFHFPLDGRHRMNAALRHHGTGQRRVIGLSVAVLC